VYCATGDALRREKYGIDVDVDVDVEEIRPQTIVFMPVLDIRIRLLFAKAIKL